MMCCTRIISVSYTLYEKFYASLFYVDRCELDASAEQCEDKTRVEIENKSITRNEIT